MIGCLLNPVVSCLKERCTSKATKFRCATSPEVVYSFHPHFNFLGYRLNRCQGDDGFYQMCGLVQDIGASVYTVGADGSIALCGYQLCEYRSGAVFAFSACAPPKQVNNQSELII